jgi:uncharacterized protein DUF5625
MKVMLIMGTLLTLLPWTVLAEVSHIPPPFSFPFDVSRRDSTVDKEFRVLEHRNYYFALRFDYADKDDLWRVLKLVGKSNATGIIVPVRLKLFRVEAGSNSEQIYDGTVETQSHYVHGFGKNDDGNYKRMIASIDLKPGLYRVHLNTIKDSPEFVGTPSHVIIEYHPNVRPRPE